MNFKGVKGVITAIWLLSVASIAMLLWNEERFFALSGIPVAKVSNTTNSVTYRSEEDTRWKFVGDLGQSIFDGDKIATGKGSFARIDFLDGRSASIGEDTTISLSTIRQASGLTYIISMPSGFVAIEKAKGSAGPNAKHLSPIIIRSGGRDFLIEPEDEKVVAHSEKGVTEFKGKQISRTGKLTKKYVAPPTNPTMANSPGSSPISGVSASVATVVEATGVDIEELEAPPSSAPPIAALSPVLLQTIAADLSIKIPDPAPQPTESIQSNPSLASPSAVPVTTPTIASANALASKTGAKLSTTSPAKASSKVASIPKEGLGIKPANPRSKPVANAPNLPTPPPVAGTEITLDATAVTPILYTFKPLSVVKGPLGNLGWKNPTTQPPGWRPLLELTNGLKKIQIDNLQGNQRTLRLEEFGSLDANSVVDGIPCATLGVRGGSKIVEGGVPRVSISSSSVQIKICSYRDAANNVPLVVGLSSLDPAIAPRDLLFTRPPVNDLKFQMIVGTPSQYLAILPLIERSTSLRVSQSNGFTSNGVFIAKTGKVIMQLAGSGFTAKSADRMLKITGGDFVYKGSKSALYDASAYSADELKEWVSKSESSGRKVYVQRSGHLLPISKDFLEERREVAAFIKTVASQIFTEKVDIIAVK